MKNSHILITEYQKDGSTVRMEYVMEYEPADMEEVFTAAERAKLADAEVLIRTDKRGWTSRYIDMVAAAQKIAHLTVAFSELDSALEAGKKELAK